MELTSACCDWVWLNLARTRSYGVKAYFKLFSLKLESYLLQVQIYLSTHLNCLILFAAGIDFRYQQIEIRIRAQGALGDEFLAASGALLVAGSQGGNDAFRTEPMQAFLRGHRPLEHVEANGAHQLAV